MERNRLHVTTSLLVLLGLATTSLATEWVSRYNGPGNGDDGARAVALSPAGRLFVTGYAAGPDSSSDFVTAWYDTATGNYTPVLFQQVPDSDRPDGAAALALDAAGNVYVTGFTTDTVTRSGTLRYPRQVTTLKYNNNLGLAWNSSYRASQTSTNPGIGGRAIAARGGAVFVTGACYDSSRSRLVAVSLGYVATTGAEKWNATHHGDAEDEADTGKAVAVDAAGRVVVAATVANEETDYDLLTVVYDSSDGDEIHSILDDVAEDAECPAALCLDAGCNIYIAGVAGTSLIVVSYDSAGTRRWAKVFEAYDCEARAMVLDSYGGLYVAGVSEGERSTTALFVAKYMAASGDTVWTRRFEPPDSSEAAAAAIALDRDGCVYATGYTTGVGAGKDYLTVKYSALGAPLDTWTYDNVGNDEATAVCVDSERTVYVTGFSAGQFGTDVATVKREQVFINDLGVTSILSPDSVVEYGEKVVPMATITANESTAAQCSVEFWIGDGSYFYRSARFVEIDSGAVLTVPFDTWYVRQPGSHVACCSLHFSDNNPGNNQLTSVVTVPPGWKEMEHMPVGLSGKQVKYGGWLAADTGSGLVYAAKGNKTNDFYRYNPSLNVWFDRHVILDGTEGKKPYKGCRGACDGGNYVYMTKGNNTLGFWRYSVSTDSWKQLADVPTGTKRKRVKDGADLVYVEHGGQGHVYLLKGNKKEFYRFDAADSAWHTLDSAPGAQKWKEGSFLVYDGDHTIYAHKAYYNQMWRYDTARDSWSSGLAGMPFIGQSGRKKKHGPGGGAAWYGGSLFALKGCNTQEFWRYDTAANGWFELDTMPQYGSALKKKRVKDGGDITSDGNVFYALKGNKTLELWRYVPQAETSYDWPGAGYAQRGHSGQTDGGETGLASGVEASLPRWNAQGTAVCYSREADDGVGAGYDQVYMVRRSQPGLEIRLVDVAMDCSEPVFNPAGTVICFVLDDTVSDRLQLATVEVPKSLLAPGQNPVPAIPAAQAPNAAGQTSVQSSGCSSTAARTVLSSCRDDKFQLPRVEKKPVAAVEPVHSTLPDAGVSRVSSPVEAGPY